ncbi:winged helix-turn-helix transcriptional regulator [Zhouia sp. PK063]|uniref:winged helix-turn-helix transcriptional regulator n=1 Tax=Zhouia sp. PK063 TaxID=3373602 RepID=UPI0037956552
MSDLTKEKNKKFSIKQSCPVRNVLDRFGDKWSVLILLVLDQEGTMRFNEIHQAIGDISQKMLTVSLRTLEADGLVSRKIYAQIPPKVEYKLTDLGHSLIPHIDALANWANQNLQTITANRLAFKN